MHRAVRSQLPWVPLHATTVLREMRSPKLCTTIAAMRMCGCKGGVRTLGVSFRKSWSHTVSVSDQTTLKPRSRMVCR